MVSPYDAVRETWKPAIKGDFETGWRKALHDGWIADTAYAKGSATGSGAKSGNNVPAPTPKDSIEIIFRPDPNIYDGRWTNVGWLQELPKPVTNLSWDNAAIVSGATLTRLGLEEDDIVELSVGNGKREGAGDRCARPSRQLRHGLSRLRTRGAAAWARGAGIQRLSDSQHLGAALRHRLDSQGRRQVGHRDHQEPLPGSSRRQPSASRARATTRSKPMRRWARAALSATPRSTSSRPIRTLRTRAKTHETPTRDTSLFPNWEYNEANAWAMSIDMNSCTGCNACIVSCYAENNIAVVGKQQVRIGRNMQWLRIDTYFEGDLAAPRAHFQPMACQHCENAPCEQVCPVGATVHTPEGLNMMVYNRCVGTRYCSNNCPYKVRRFNFLLYSDYETESLKLMRNPDVSVRSRGVMEKCSYCVQRIQAAKIEADKENRNIRDGEIVTACQQACPANAIIFGNMNDQEQPGSETARPAAQLPGDCRPEHASADAVCGRSVESEPGTRRDAGGTRAGGNGTKGLRD